MAGIDLAAKLNRREKVFTTMISHTTWTGIIPVLKKRNLDFVLFEMEHSHYDWRDLEGLLRMCKMLDLPSVVRVTDIAYHQISLFLDMGATGVLIPRIERFEQLEQVINMVRLPPVGQKGVGGYDFSVGDLTAKLANYNKEKLILIQIEREKAIPELDKMLATGEVAGVIVGPFDLSVSLGIPGEFDHPQFLEAVQNVIRICDERKVSCGMFLGEEANIRHWRGQGMNLIWSGSDMSFFINGYNQLCDTIDSIK
ncbi:HpcH/HpaI aldolase family protein [Paenibacillus eucommiae]|uniref:2-keto-3-deoxy-L-rhamnonate aldolase RhmA n=1 Tax=Paenibacillus eucommiae TaxID=1355755 RepID=A0ABS4ILX4_9BACL|nr:aldolase/citrate lyase family protein [Paenibacillus eucommiae]MBP1988563.1 2-keto-3-deoxy-L-rhamnonate aldolase RhmA [Paenibacillus eucommiae]